jgi:thiamine-monophosphate kinase
MRDNSHTQMGSGEEFDAIRDLLDAWGDLAVDIGDDAAILTGDASRSLVISTDACIDGIHFQRDWLSPRDVGARACAAALSDLAAMGARATGVLVALAVPPLWLPDLRDVAAGIGEVVRNVNARVIGGNMTRSPVFGITLTVVGEAARPVRRSGARAGDVLLLTGMLGGPRLAIDALTAGRSPSSWSISRFTRPVPRLAEGMWFAAHDARAMIDISDGLLADAGHMARASGVDIVMHADSVPHAKELSAMEALGGGEEYELLIAVDAGRAAALCQEFRRQFDIDISLVGEVRTANGMGRVTVDDVDPGKTAERVEITAGHDHFSQ